MKISVYLTHPTIPCWNLSPAQHRRLGELLPGAKVLRATSEAEFLDSLADARIAVVWRFEQDWLARAQMLEWIVTPAAGRDYFHIEPRPGLEIEYGGFHGPLIGETVLGMLLGHYRGLFLGERLRGRDAWPREALAQGMRALRGARLTILGFGSIGTWIGRLAKPFGPRITGIARRPREAPAYFGAGDRILTAERLDGCLADTDCLVIVLPATPSTDRILDARRLDLLPSHAIVVNVGRGNAIDEDALAKALADGRLAGAYLDVYSQEPLPETSPLRDAPNAFLFPHASAIAPQYLDLFIDELARKFAAKYA